MQGDRKEQERLNALHGYRLLDTPREPEFDELAECAARLADTPIALISLVDADRQWFKASVGLEATETPRSISFCSYAIEGGDVMIVPDATRDARFADNPLVRDDPSIRFYAGAPLEDERGMRIGTLCVIDREPREGLSESSRAALKDLARKAMKLIAGRIAGQGGGES